jgi:hypothetical protein
MFFTHAGLDRLRVPCFSTDSARCPIWLDHGFVQADGLGAVPLLLFLCRRSWLQPFSFLIFVCYPASSERSKGTESRASQSGGGIRLVRALTHPNWGKRPPHRPMAKAEKPPPGKVAVTTGSGVIFMDEIPQDERAQRERNRREPWKSDPTQLPGLDRAQRPSITAMRS